MNSILTPINKYVKVVDIAINHSPEITYVYGHRPLDRDEVLTCVLKRIGLGWSAAHPSSMSVVYLMSLDVHTRSHGFRHLDSTQPR